MVQLQTLPLFNMVDYSYDKTKARKYWMDMLSEVKETGNFKTRSGKFFHHTYTPEERIEYCNKMININKQNNGRSQQSQNPQTR
jgi:hypothetical protein